MQNYDPFNTLKTFGIGYDSFLKSFDDTLNMLDKTYKNASNIGYPPFNISKVDDNNYVIEMAVAGFGKSNLDINIQDNVLTVSGRLEGDYDDSNYLYKGISGRAFTRKFALADTVEIRNADLINGMLKIFLENIIPESKKPRKIEIGDKASTDKFLDAKPELLTEKDKKSVEEAA